MEKISFTCHWTRSNTWEFPQGSILKQYLDKYLPSSEYPGFGFSSHSNETTVEKVLQGIKFICARDKLFDSDDRPRYIICNDELAQIAKNSPQPISLQNDELILIIEAHLISVPASRESIVVERHEGLDDKD